MERLQDFSKRELHWEHPHLFKREYELRADRNIVATVHWEGTFNYQVYPETAQESWIFKPKGLWQKRLVIYRAENNQTTATFQRTTDGHGILRFSDGRLFIYDNINLRSGEWAWLNNENTPLVHFVKHSRVQIEPWANTLSALPLLIVFGFFLLKLADAEAVSASLEMVG
jgi:hypothetical protein